MNGEPLKILLVEDNMAHAKLAMRGLKDHKVANEIIHLSDGEAAMDYLFRRGAYADPQKSPLPHIILLDLRLPKVDGLDVLKAVKTNDLTKKIPVVVLTTSQAEGDITMAYENYANAYLTKPVDFEKFMTLMNDLGFFWLLWNMCPQTNSM